MTTKQNKIRPKHCHGNKNTKSRGEGIERRKAKLAAGLLEGSEEAKVLWNFNVLVA